MLKYQFKNLVVVLFFSAIISTSGFSVELKPILVGPDKVRFKRYLECSKLVEAIVNSDDFGQKILSYKFTSTKKSNDQILLDIYSGSEKLTPGSDLVWDWKVGFYFKRFTKVIGWTNPSTPIVWVNTAKFDHMDCPEIAANIAHEYLHKIGYDHKSAKDLTSVPYAIGYMVEDLAQANEFVKTTSNSKPHRLTSVLE